MIAVFHIKFISSTLNTFDLPHLNFQINLSLTSSLARPPQLLSFFEVKTIQYSNFQSTSLVRRKQNDNWIYENKEMQRTSKIA